MTDYDTTEKVEETETGYKLKVSSIRGTGTRDQDTVNGELRSEEYPSEDETAELVKTVEWIMEKRRSHQPDTESDE